MKKARLQHHADILAHMACGWRIVGDAKELARRGRGTIEIDALTGAAIIDGQPARLGLALELAAWLKRDRLEQGVPEDYITRALVTLAFAAHVSASGASVTFDRDAKSIVDTVAGTYRGSFSKSDEPAYAL